MNRLHLALALCASLLTFGCASAPRQNTQVDLSAPGWQMRQGQAVWRPGSDKPEIVGDVVVSTHSSGTAQVQFSKTLPIASGQLSANSWSMEFAPENKSYSGRGNPPKRIVWLQMLRALEGGKAADRWNVIRPSNDFIALENPESGERLEVHFQN